MARIASWGRVSFGMLACVAACAGSQRSAAPERKPSAMATPVSRAAEPPPAAQSPVRPPSVDIGSSSTGQSISEEFARRPPEAADPHGASGARVRFAEARRELELAANERDCARACRALESMERAAQQVCELARSPEERKECTSAGEQVDKARSKVQSACGACPQKLR